MHKKRRSYLTHNVTMLCWKEGQKLKNDLSKLSKTTRLKINVGRHRKKNSSNAMLWTWRKNTSNFVNFKTGQK